MAGAILAALALPARAGDYEARLDGEHICPVSSDSIRLARQRVEALVVWPDEPTGHAFVCVTAEMVLVNDADKPRSILVAFPDGCRVRGFTRLVDDRPVEVARHESKGGPAAAAFASRVDFDAGQVRRVRVKYVGSGDAQGGWPHAGRWAYPLKAGGGWKGKVGEARVVVRFPMSMPPGGFGPFRPEAVRLTPAPGTFEGQTATWVLKDFEPDQDVVVQWSSARALDAARPLELASREEAPCLQLAMAKALLARGQPKRALAALGELRKAFPARSEARLVDYHVAQAYSYHYIKDGKLANDGLDPKAAAAHYRAALKQPLKAPHRQDALCELFLLHVVESPDAAEAAKALDLLKKEKLTIDAHGDLLAKITLALPEAALELLNTMTASPGRQWLLHSSRAEISKRLADAPKR